MSEKVLVGTVPLLYVQSVTMTEGYRVERVLGSRFSQATQPTTKTIAIEAMLLGPERHAVRKALEVMALASRALMAAAAPALAVTGIPVVCGLTLSPDMQITDLRFTQSVQKRDAFDLSLTLQYVPRSSLTALIGEVADLVMSAGSAGVPSVPAPGPVPRTPGP
ncbi:MULTISPECIES: hypothetical protein [unclassified Streptomyces]|uniref:hypothetical protein n=1 Tax=unclassified Streptomyces TaxID=2593676 RepID=UPI0016617AB2|nr:MULTISPECIES: hypothetical protein [unclassified Streptomyces]MBD0708191.1 hypothetical protein [Streptomyces sp. CBMA291]MBD0714499.1 hypothetical protein [Streptomyces sp. CBMA370]